MLDGTHWSEFLIGAFAWLTICGMIWAVLWIVFPKIDRRPKDSVRCRKCRYDLRACRSDECPECGATLTETGVWPIGRPSRKKLVTWLMLWFWFCSYLTLMGTGYFRDYYRDVAAFMSVEKGVIVVKHPASQAFDSVSISLSGDGWEFFPEIGYESSELSHGKPKAVSILIRTAGVFVQSVVFDPATNEIVPHPNESVAAEDEFIRAGIGSQIGYGDQLTPENLAEFHAFGLDPELDKQVLEEMAYLIDLARICASNCDLTRSADDTQAIAEDVTAQTQASGMYGGVFSIGDRLYIAESQQLSKWWIALPPSLGFIFFVVGIYAIRRWSYRRDTVAWELPTEFV